MRSGWPTPATSATGSSSSSCARARSAAAARFHVACADADGNVELLMQAGFMRYGEEQVLVPAGRHGPARAVVRRARRRLPASGRRRRSTRCRWPGCTRAATPAPVARLEAIRLADWERQGTPLARAALEPRPRSCASPTSRASSRRRPAAARTGPQLDGFLQVGVAKEDQPHYLKVLARPEADVSDLVDFGLGVIAARTTQGRRPSPRPRRHRSRANLRITDRPATGGGGFDSIASVNLLMKETLVRVAEPALVPAGVR